MTSDIKFVEIDSQSLNNDLVRKFEEVIGETFYPGDERRIFLLQLSQVVVGLKNDINETGKQNLLRYASGDVLDELGALYNTPRLPSLKSKSIVKFTLSATQPQNITIPQGTRVTPDGALYFATTKPLAITAGSIDGEVDVEALHGGAAYNGFLSGQIKSIVDPIPFVTSAINTIESYGGTEVEKDDDYRERIRLAPASFSVAGPEDAYIYWAKTADVNIEDIRVYSPDPGVVKVVVLMKHGEMPSINILEAVENATSQKNRRPLTDNVSAIAPDVVNYNINLTYYISQDRNTEEVSIREKIENQGGAIDKYVSWQKMKLKRDINPDYLRQLMLNAGAFKIDLSFPVHTELTENQVAIVDSVNVEYGGLI